MQEAVGVWLATFDDSALRDRRNGSFILQNNVQGSATPVSPTHKS